MLLMKKMGVVPLAAIVLMLTVFLPAIASAEASAVTPSGVAAAAIEAQVDRVMAKYIGRDVPGAAVSVVLNGDIVLLKGYGLANVEQSLPMSAEATYMEAGSISKVFTWTAVMQLVEQGKLDLDADIRDYLPERFLKLSWDKPITLLHLMNHTAGFEEYTDQLIVRDSAKLLPLEQRIGPGSQPKQVYEPGTVIAYSNFSTSLAGLIVERVSGEPFEEYINKHIFAPLDMNRSSFAARYDLIAGMMHNKAIGYSKADDTWTSFPNFYVNDLPAGSLTTTAEDLARFMIAQLNTDGTAPYSLFADTSTLREMHQTSFTHHPSLPGSAHGFWERYSGPHRIIEHGGNTQAFSSLLSLVPEAGFGVSILTNVAAEMAGARREVTDVLIGFAAAEGVITPGLNHASDVAGRYRSARAVESGTFKLLPVLADADTIITAKSDGTIRLTIPAYELDIAYAETEPYVFKRIMPGNTFIDNSGMDISRIYFKTDDNGAVTALSYGTIADELPVPLTRVPLFNYVYIGGSGIVLVAGLLVGAFGLLIRLTKRLLRKTTGSKASSPLRSPAVWLSLLGVLNFANVIAMIVRLTADPFLPLVGLTIHTVIFWLLGAAAAVAIYRIVRIWSSPANTLLMKCWIVLLAVALLLVVVFLYSYNFYAFVF